MEREKCGIKWSLKEFPTQRQKKVWDCMGLDLIDKILQGNRSEILNTEFEESMESTKIDPRKGRTW